MVNITDPLYPIFQKVISKHNKSHIIGSKNKIVGNSLAIGKPGSGKTTNNRRESELRYELNHKIFCLYDAGRMDMCYFAFPSISPFWKVPKLERGKIITSRKYPIQMEIPVTSGMPKKLPNCAVPFTIAVSDLELEDLVALVGSKSSDTIRGAYSYMKKFVDESTTPEEYMDLLVSAYKKADESGVKLEHHGVKKIKEMILQPLMNEGLLSSKQASTAIDIRALIKDKKTISVLILRHCPKSLWGFLVFFFMNHLEKILSGFGETKRLKQRTTIVLNEVADLLSTDEEKGTSAHSISKMISKIAKQWRTGSIYLLMDTQIPSELPELKENIERVYVYKSGMAAIEKAMAITGISKLAGDITDLDYSIIPRLGKGWYYLFDSTMGVSIHKLEWLRSRTYLDGEDFYDIYSNVYGKTTGWQDVSEKLNELKMEQEKSTELLDKKKQINKERIARKKGKIIEKIASVPMEENIIKKDDNKLEKIKEEISKVEQMEKEFKTEDIEEKAEEEEENVIEDKEIDWKQASKLIKAIR